VDKRPLTTIGEEKTIEDKEDWLRRQTAPSLAVVYQAYKLDMNQIELLLKDGLQRLTAKDHGMIRRFQEQQKTPDVD
jgi:hypothetical protein